MKKLIALFLISALLTGCANLKGESVPEVSDEIESSSEITSEAAEYTSEPDSEPTSLVDVEEIIQDDWVTIDDAVAPPPSKPVEYDNERVDYTIEEAAEIINKIDNFTAAKDLIVDLPSHIDHLSYYTERRIGSNGFPPIAEQVKQFMSLYCFFAPDKEFYPEYFYSRGIKLNDDSLTPIYVPFYMNYRELINDKVFDEKWDVRYIYDYIKSEELADYENPFYDDTFFLMKQREPKDGYVHLSCSYPYGGSYLLFDFGVINKTLRDMGISSISDAEYVGVFEPDSEESYQLLDKKTMIKDAVKVYEDYINSIPTLFEPIFNIRVKDVQVYKVNDELYFYNFIAVREYEGIKYDNLGEAGDVVGGDDFHSEYILGYMIQSDRVDYFYGSYARAMEMADKTERTDIIPFDKAVQEIKDRLSAHVEFEITEARIVYSDRADLPSDNWYDRIVTPCYKIVAHNLNDDRYYFCYLNACDKSDFRYYSASYHQ